MALHSPQRAVPCQSHKAAPMRCLRAALVGSRSTAPSARTAECDSRGNRYSSAGKPWAGFPLVARGAPPTKRRPCDGHFAATGEKRSGATFCQLTSFPVASPSLAASNGGRRYRFDTPGAPFRRRLQSPRGPSLSRSDAIIAVRLDRMDFEIGRGHPAHPNRVWFGNADASAPPSSDPSSCRR
jgi:hypothetical protein